MLTLTRELTLCCTEMGRPKVQKWGGHREQGWLYLKKVHLCLESGYCAAREKVGLSCGNKVVIREWAGNRC